jgi:hypothetical protein
VSRRVVIQGGNAAHPFRVGSPGVNADTADLFDLFFDGNQSPLRIWGTGFVAVTPLEHDNLAPAHFHTGPGVIATPAGLFPVFIVNGRPSYNPNSGTNRLTTVESSFGGVVAQNTFFGINIAREVVVQGGIAPLTSALVNYCIFRNYG